MQITLATIIGFIIGSLGVVWPWKKTIYQRLSDGTLKLDKTGSVIIENYERFIPDPSTETFLALAYILLGILIVLGLEWYGEQTRTVKI